MKLAAIATQILLLISCPGVAQNSPLKSASHGLDMMLKDVSKEQLIEEMRFEDGKDDTIGVVRFDHVGPNIYPLIVSAKLPVATDSLGILSFKLQKDTLYNFLYTIDHINPKVYSRHLDKVLIRITYRFHGRLAQYYVTNAKIVCGFFRIIEKLLVDNKDTDALDKFYQFVAETRLLKGVNGKRVWVY